MAFNFLGTLSLPQLNELRSFITQEIEDIEAQINLLRVERDNLERTRQGFVASDSYFGGNTIATINEEKFTDVYNIPRQNDSYPASFIQKAKFPFIQNIKYKRERLEFKIKKLSDAIEQDSEMIDRKAIAKTQTQELLNEVEKLFGRVDMPTLFQTTEELENFQKGIGVE